MGLVCFRAQIRTWSEQTHSIVACFHLGFSQHEFSKTNLDKKKEKKKRTVSVSMQTFSYDAGTQANSIIARTISLIPILQDHVSLIGRRVVRSRPAPRNPGQKSAGREPGTREPEVSGVLDMYAYIVLCIMASCSD